MSGRIRCLPRGSAERVRILRNGSTGLPTAATTLPADPPHATGTARHPSHRPVLPADPQCDRPRCRRRPSGPGSARGSAMRAPTAPASHRAAPAPSRRSSASENNLVNASPEQLRKRYHASKGKPRPWGRYSASTAMRATFSKGSLARRTGTDAVCKRCRIFKGIPSLCKRYNTCKVWYRCTSGGISVKAAPLFHRCEMRPGAVVGQRRRLHGALRVQRDASGQETTHWGRACAGGTGAEGGIGGRKPPIGAGY